jgi:opacity protein-like surface antigen
MKRTFLGVVTAVLALTASAQVVHSQTSMQFGIAAGATLPTGDLGDFLDTGFHGMATLGFSPTMVPFAMRIDGMYNSLDASEGDGTARILAFSANGIFSMGGMMAAPYLIGGVGFYNTDFDIPGADAQNDFGFNIGLGAKFNLSGFGTFAEIRFHHVMSEEEDTGLSSMQFIPLTFGIMF